MEKKIRNLIINEKKFENAAKNKKKFRKRIVSLGLVITLITGGYLAKDYIFDMINNIVETPKLPRYDEVYEEPSPNSIIVFGGKEYLFEDFQKEYGDLAIIIMPMTEEEVRLGYKRLFEAEKRWKEHFFKTQEVTFGGLKLIPYDDDYWKESMIRKDQIVRGLIKGLREGKIRSNAFTSVTRSKIIEMMAEHSILGDYMKDGKIYDFDIIGEHELLVFNNGDPESLPLELREFIYKMFIINMKAYETFLLRNGYDIDDVTLGNSSKTR